jgi:membrane protease YdiL (CAAX protease family)
VTEIEGPQGDPAPWTIRDIWLGVGSLFLWQGLLIGARFVLHQAALEVDYGLFVALGELLLLLLVWLLTMRKHRVGWEALGLRSFHWPTIFLAGGLMVFSLGFNLLHNFVLLLFGLRAQVDWVTVFAELSSPWWLLLAGAIVAPFVEELFFRGFLFAGLRKHCGWPKAALISSLLFSLFHLQPLAILPIFVLGYILAFLYQHSRSIWPAILIHFSNNALALGVAYLLSRMGS